MTRIADLDELDARISACSEAMERKFSGARGKRHILVCSGTGCLSSSSQDIYETFVRRVEETGLADRVTVNQVGCFGLCSQGPFVKIYPEDTLYRLVTVEDVDIVDTYRQKRAAALYGEDERSAVRQSHNNPQIRELYKKYLGEPNSHTAHELLHTTYAARKPFRIGYAESLETA